MVNELERCECGAVFITKDQLEKHQFTCNEVDNDTPEVMKENNYRVMNDQCEEWREEILSGRYVADIASEEDVCKSTVRHHVNGICTHDGDVSPMEWDNSDREWTAKDE